MSVKQKDNAWTLEFLDKTYKAGNDQSKAVKLLIKLAECKRANIIEREDGLYLCWDLHEKGEKCDYVKEIDYNDLASEIQEPPKRVIG